MQYNIISPTATVDNFLFCPCLAATYVVRWTLGQPVAIIVALENEAGASAEAVHSPAPLRWLVVVVVVVVVLCIDK